MQTWRTLPGMLLVALLAGCGGGGARSGPVSGAPPATTVPDARSSNSRLQAAWTTFQGRSSRDGQAADGPGPTARRRWTAPVDGDVYAQPLLVGDAVLVATEADTLYAFDATSGAQRWRTSIGTPVPADRLPCGNIDPVGITGTPVADVAHGTLWAVAFTAPARHELVGVDLTTGAVRSRRVVDPPGSDPLAQSQRAALALAGDRVIVAFGGRYGDCGRYHGWVVAAPVDGAPSTNFQVPTGREGGIWAPSGPSVTDAGEVLVSTGNSEVGTTYDEGNSVLRLGLDPELHQVDAFAPADWAKLNEGDVDIGSIGPAPVGDGLVFQSGKAGVGYLLRADHLGGVGGAVSTGRVCAGGAYGGIAVQGERIVVPCRDGLAGLTRTGTTFQATWHGPGEVAGTPILTPGAVWYVATGPGELVALDPASGRQLARLPVGPVPHFAAPAAGAGRLVVGGRRQVVAFGA